MRKSTWDREKRLRLESLLKFGYGLQAVADRMELTRPTIREEINRGITEEEANERRWSQYRASRARLREFIDEVGADNVETALQELKKEWKLYDRNDNCRDANEPVSDAGTDG